MDAFAVLPREGVIGDRSCLRARRGGDRGLGPFTLNLEDLQVALENSLSPVPPTGIPLTLWALIKQRKSAELW